MIPQAEPPKAHELTEAYRDAHIYYILVAGLLACWELIGISLEAQPNWGFEIESAPKWLFLVLLISVIFCGYRMNIQWMRCNPESRKHAAPNRVPRAAHRIALVAVAIAIIQYLLHNQIVGYIAHHQGQTFVVAAVVTFAGAAIGVGEMLALADTTPKILRWLLISTIVLAIGRGFDAVARQSYSILFATFPGALSALVLYRIRWKTKPTSHGLRP